MQHKYEIARAINFWTVDKNRNDGKKCENREEKTEAEAEKARTRTRQIRDNMLKILTFFRSRERCRIQRTFYSTMPFVDVPWSSLC